MRLLVSAGWRGECWVCRSLFQALHANECFCIYSLLCRRGCHLFFIYLVKLSDATNVQEPSTQWSVCSFPKGGGGGLMRLQEWNIRITRAYPMSSEVSVELSQPCRTWIQSRIWCRGTIKKQHLQTDKQLENNRIKGTFLRGFDYLFSLILMQYVFLEDVYKLQCGWEIFGCFNSITDNTFMTLLRE